MKIPIGGLVAIVGGMSATYLDFWGKLGWIGSFFLLSGLLVFWMLSPDPNINLRGE